MPQVSIMEILSYSLLSSNESKGSYLKPEVPTELTVWFRGTKKPGGYKDMLFYTT
jgi:hypothetical protein